MGFVLASGAAEAGPRVFVLDDRLDEEGLADADDPQRRLASGANHIVCVVA